jgi:hypothetical protein
MLLQGRLLSMFDVEWKVPPDLSVRSSRCVARPDGGSKVVMVLLLGMASSCTDDPGGGPGETTVCTTFCGTSGSATDGTSGADPLCVDQQDGNDSVENAYALALNFNDIDVVELGGRLCDKTSDWYKLRAPCTSFLGVETRTVDDSGGGAPEPVEKVRTRLYHEPPPADPRRLTTGSFGMHPMHLQLQGGEDYYIEVEHRADDPVEYTLRVTVLPDGSCTSAAYICEGDAQAIAATETSCELSPSGSSCPSGDVHTKAVALPEVWDGTSGSVGGWAIFAGAHEVRNPQRPTTSEAALLQSRCIEACTQEWASIDEISASCSSGSFTDIVLREASSIPSVALIPSGLEDGSEVFPGVPGAGCDLQGDCCERFVSNLCPFRPGRVQPGPEGALGFREQYIFSLTGSATLTGAQNPVSVTGTARFSEADPQWPSPRPVYLDFSFSRQANTELNLDCSDGSQASPTIQGFGVALTQPAFGVRTPDLVGFPPGAVVYRMFVMVDSEVIAVDRVSEVDVYGEASAQGVALQLAEAVRIPCGEGTADVMVEVDLVDASTVSHPPEITMNLPGSASCPGHVTLDAMVSDPENDVESVRWRVNGHLMAPSVERVDIEASGTVFEVVACDSRGGCVREEATVDCLPYCGGTAVPCSQYTGSSSSLCNSQPGCWVTGFFPPNLYICGGSRSCDQFGQTDCTVAHGCTWMTP